MYDSQTITTKQKKKHLTIHFHHFVTSSLLQLLESNTKQNESSNKWHRTAQKPTHTSIHNAQETTRRQPTTNIYHHTLEKQPFVDNGNKQQNIVKLNQNISFSNKPNADTKQRAKTNKCNHKHTYILFINKNKH